MSDRPPLDLEPHEWRLKGAKRTKPFRPPPMAPYKPTTGLIKLLTWLSGIWCAICWIVVKQFDHADGLTVFIISMGPFLVLAFVLIIRD
jgi:hypothetical protein